uniref:GTPase n=1 Tax=Brachyspira catarrhinii TaxID=2528966 RepID=UPI003F4C8595
MSENNQKLNLLVIGDKGSGKSSLIDSFLGNDIKLTDRSKPNEAEINGHNVTIYENNEYKTTGTMGIETTSSYNDNINMFLNGKNKKSVVITYCIDSNISNIKNEDINGIKDYEDLNYSLIIAFTKTDKTNKEKLNNLVKEIKKRTKNHRIITIANTEENNYFGVEEYKKAVFRTFKRNNSTNDYIELNLLVLGQTGVGKSSLLNALVGQKIENTSVGKPCTLEGIFPHEETIDGKDVVIYDSWGIEVEKSEEWYNMINKELIYRSVDKDIKDWFHCATYCIQAGGAKIQDFDIKIIKQFLEDKYNVIVALTKADQINEDKEKEFIEIIKKETGIETVIAVGAAPEKHRGQEKADPPFGLKEYKEKILESWKKIFIGRVPLNIIKKLEKDINEKTDEFKKRDFSKEDLDNLEKLSEKIIYEFNSFLNEKASEYVWDSIIKYSIISDAIKNINKDLDDIEFNSSDKMKNFESFLVKIFSPGNGSSEDLTGPEMAITIALSPLLLVAGILTVVFGGITDGVRLAIFNIRKKLAIKEFIGKLSEEFKKQINNKKFEDQLRDAIEKSFLKIEEEIKKELEKHQN